MSILSDAFGIITRTANSVNALTSQVTPIVQSATQISNLFRKQQTNPLPPAPISYPPAQPDVRQPDIPQGDGSYLKKNILYPEAPAQSNMMMMGGFALIGVLVLILVLKK